MFSGSLSNASWNRASAFVVSPRSRDSLPSRNNWLTIDGEGEVTAAAGGTVGCATAGAGEYAEAGEAAGGRAIVFATACGETRFARARPT